MALISTRQCDQCSETILDGMRWFRMAIDLRVINSHTRIGAQGMSDFCSERCLLDALTSLIHETEVKTGDGVSLTVTS